MKPKVTVFICTFNRVELLCEAIKSVLAQTYENFKIVILNNASEDNTLEVINSFTDPRLSFITHIENIGGARNWNFALDNANTEYFVILHDDDIMFPWMLEEGVKILDAHQEVVLSGSMPLLSAGTIKAPDRKENVSLVIYRYKEFIKEVCSVGYNPLILSSVLFRTKDIQESGIRFKCPLLADLYFWFECNLTRPFQMCITKEPLFQYRVHRNATTSRLNIANTQVSAQMLEGLFLIEKLLKDECPDFDLSRMYEFLAIWCLMSAMRKYCAGFIDKTTLLAERKRVEDEYGWVLPDWRFEDKLAVTYLQDVVLSVKSGTEPIDKYLDAVADAEKIGIKVSWKRHKIWFGDSYIQV